eukprot:gnl/TRDRNA2_/TRDRNA2_147906_c0_seq2.p1 gnl/TRDRNA2_/TRDRNA2_147906_c0~~gnl/TRDRNA2_/TRDRNA2_147906_c0_seq2.p1  ORF type:complete len:546 (-),score=103.16 gnl/TRDRNA2_/TRDRNA2_147906_c0_seq2:29-1666(-)
MADDWDPFADPADPAELEAAQARRIARASAPAYAVSGGGAPARTSAPASAVSDGRATARPSAPAYAVSGGGYAVSGGGTAARQHGRVLGSNSGARHRHSEVSVTGKSDVDDESEWDLYTMPRKPQTLRGAADCGRGSVMPAGKSCDANSEEEEEWDLYTVPQKPPPSLLGGAKAQSLLSHGGAMSESEKEAGTAEVAYNGPSLEEMLARLDEDVEVEALVDVRRCQDCKRDVEASKGTTGDDSLWYCNHCWAQWDPEAQDGVDCPKAVSSSASAVSLQDAVSGSNGKAPRKMRWQNMAKSKAEASILLESQRPSSGSSMACKVEGASLGRGHTDKLASLTEKEAQDAHERSQRWRQHCEDKGGIPAPIPSLHSSLRTLDHGREEDFLGTVQVYADESTDRKIERRPDNMPSIDEYLARLEEEERQDADAVPDLGSVLARVDEDEEIEASRHRFFGLAITDNEPQLPPPERRRGGSTAALSRILRHQTGHNLEDIVPLEHRAGSADGSLQMSSSARADSSAAASPAATSLISSRLRERLAANRRST